MTVFHIHSGVAGHHPVINAYLALESPESEEIALPSKLGIGGRLFGLAQKILTIPFNKKSDLLHVHDPLVGLLAIVRYGPGAVVYDAHEISWTLKKNRAIRLVIYVVERGLIALASKVIFPSLERQWAMTTKQSERFFVIENLVPGALVASAQQLRVSVDSVRSHPGEVRVVWGGLVNEARCFQEVIDACSTVAEEKGIKFQLDVYGSVASGYTFTCKSDAVTVHLLGTKPREAVIRALMQADFAFALYKPVNENYRLCAPTKIFEYEALGVRYLLNESPYVTRLYREGRLLFAELIPSCEPDSLEVGVSAIIESFSEANLNWRRHHAKPRKLLWEDQYEEIKKIYSCL